MKRTLLFVLALIASGCADPIPRNLDGLVQQGDTYEALKKMGHRVEVVTNGVMSGGYQAIYRNPDTGIYSGATEMRKDGLAIGY